MLNTLAAILLAAVLQVNLSSVTAADASSTSPNIIFIIADDLGWNDVSFHGSDQIPTPNIDALAYHGVILNSHYVQPVCTPSRAALMTGRYPIRTGMQGIPLLTTSGTGLPEGTILPQYLKELGYVTRAVGKWHLGYHRKELTPTYRGFDSHLGYWNGMVGYHDYIIQSEFQDQNGFDLRRNMTTAWELSGRYATDVFTEEAERLIQEHDVSRPLFLYLAHLACHSGDAAQLLAAPRDALARFGYISDPNRRLLAGVLWKLDESVGRVVAALELRGMLNNSIVVFISDNGAPTIGPHQNWGSNYPLRGKKQTLWEGGVRGAALVWSPLLQNTPRVSNQLMHISDWLPTLYAATGGDSSALPDDLDGINLWNALVDGSESARKEVLINIDEKKNNSAIRVGDLKLVKGVIASSSDSGYLGQSGSEDGGRTPPFSAEQVLSSTAGRAVANVLGGATPAEEMRRLRAEATVSCPDRPQQPSCEPQGPDDVCVFNVATDPCEAGQGDAPADTVATLLERLEALAEPLVPQDDSQYPALADPRRWNNSWVPWADCLQNAQDPVCNAVSDDWESTQAPA